MIYHCHFLSLNKEQTYHSELSENVREEIRNGKILNLYPPNGGLCCYLKVWDASQMSRNEYAKKKLAAQGENQIFIQILKEQINQTARDNFCFFWKDRPGMSFEAAQVLQKRESDNREASIDRKDTKTSLRMAMVAIIVTAILGVANTIIGVFNCRKHDNHISFIKQVKQTNKQKKDKLNSSGYSNTINR